jgi:hypothetical protein
MRHDGVPAQNPVQGMYVCFGVVFCTVFRESCDERGFGMHWLPNQEVIQRVSYRLSRITDQNI